MKLNFVTSNEGKLKWVETMLKKFDIKIIQKKLDLTEPRDTDVLEVVKHKCEEAKNKISEPFIVEDSGFYIKALNGFPSTFVKFGLSTIGVDGICRLLKSEKNRKAYFKSVLGYFDGKETHFFICKDDGDIAKEPRGENLRGFNELFKIFIPQGFSKTLAEMSDTEYDSYQDKIKVIDHYHLFSEWLVNETK